MKLKNLMEKDGYHLNVVIYNTIIHGFFKEGELHEANKIFTDMKAMDVAPNTVDILTYNALILGFCKESKTKQNKKNAASLLKELNKQNLFPNSSTFSALISGQRVRQNSECAFQLHKSMRKSGYHLNADTFKIMMCTFCKNEGFDGAVQVLRKMLERSLAPD
ncbi:hypothetical protein HHK36_005788 [Tetracentron sinense]|uniref:Pentatricopeptide repeat-containing protein n=1 Tax=Tetracentron sinense TaxID=13715 RepID=A0A834ZL64_TETSI|nr:hypothetical protein HHK36_005788 [Tetracentron sinense]